MKVPTGWALWYAMDPARSVISVTEKLLGCTSARISRPLAHGKHFLIIGFTRSTKDDPGQWMTAMMRHS